MGLVGEGWSVVVCALGLELVGWGWSVVVCAAGFGQWWFELLGLGLVSWAWAELFVHLGLELVGRGWSVGFGVGELGLGRVVCAFGFGVGG